MQPRTRLALVVAFFFVAFDLAFFLRVPAIALSPGLGLARGFL